jgi:4-hydroxy-tetrahydrodipicolinate synthase
LLKHRQSVILYNVPGRTASNMLPSVVRLANDFANVVAIKEAAGDMYKQCNY